MYEGKICPAGVQRSTLEISWGEHLAASFSSGAAHSPGAECVTEMTIFLPEEMQNTEMRKDGLKQRFSWYRMPHLKMNRPCMDAVAFS